MQVVEAARLLPIERCLCGLRPGSVRRHAAGAFMACLMSVRGRTFEGESEAAISSLLAAMADAVRPRTLAR